jgi:hypothetical protein
MKPACENLNENYSETFQISQACVPMAEITVYVKKKTKIYDAGRMWLGFTDPSNITLLINSIWHSTS